MSLRHVIVAIPARNERDRIVSCLSAIARLDPDPRIGGLKVVVLANNCDDDTVAVARAFASGAGLPVECLEASLPKERAHAGWARRLALDAAADRLATSTDVIFSTDADTVVAKDWVARSLDYFDGGYDAVAGAAELRPAELRELPRAHRARLARIRRYERAFDYVRAREDGGEPWPRHFYEGGASIALTLGCYRATGGAPTPPVGEDKALFQRVREVGRRIRHPRNVRVSTSCRLDGRAPGGAADTLARWGVQNEDEGLWGLRPVAAAFGAPAGEVTFATLMEETRLARELVAVLRSQTGATGGAHPVRRQTSRR